jgi:alkylmercury lyase
MTDHHACADAEFLSSLDGFEFVPHLVRLLAQARPVGLNEIAAVGHQPVEDLEQLVRSQPGTEWDDQGRLVGFGLTTRPTEHRFKVAGRTLYTWCATDTLFFTAILGRSTSVESNCPATGEPIRIEITADTMVSLTPSAAVVSQRHHDELLSDVRAQVCDHGHFFSSPAAASGWKTEHPEGAVLPVRAAFDNARAACAELGWLGTGPRTS